MSGGPVTARLTRGDGARQWETYRSTDKARLVVFYRCPFCNQMNSLAPASITADGLVARLTSCAYAGCEMTYQLLLEGWRFDRVDTAAVFPGPFGQADGCGF